MISIAFVVLCRVGCLRVSGVVLGHVDFTLLEDKTDCDSFKSEIRSTLCLFCQGELTTI